MTRENSLEIALPPPRNNIRLCDSGPSLASPRGVRAPGVSVMMIHRPHEPHVVLDFQKRRLTLSVH